MSTLRQATASAAVAANVAWAKAHMHIRAMAGPFAQPLLDYINASEEEANNMATRRRQFLLKLKQFEQHMPPEVREILDTFKEQEGLSNGNS